MSVKHTINCDWLEFNLKCHDVSLFSPNNVQSVNKTKLIYKGKGNKFYDHYWQVIHNKKDFGVCFSSPHMGKSIQPDNVQFHLSNNRLYEQGWNYTLHELIYDLQSQYRSITRCDIAIDGGNFFNVFEDWNSGKIVKLGKALVMGRFSGKRLLNTAYIGDFASRKQIKCYNKSKEILTSKKRYIQKFWERSGLINTTNVERLELRFNNEENKKVYDMNFEKLDDTYHLSSLFRTHTKNFFDFVESTPGKNISRKFRIQPIDWSSIGGELLPKLTTVNTSEMWAAQITIKRLYQIYYVTKKKSYYDHAYEIAFNIDDLAWFKKQIPKWEDDVNKKIGINPDGLISNNWITTFELHTTNDQITIELPEAEIKKKLQYLNN